VDIGCSNINNVIRADSSEKLPNIEISNDEFCFPKQALGILVLMIDEHEAKNCFHVFLWEKQEFPFKLQTGCCNRGYCCYEPNQITKILIHRIAIPDI
jgi:hypothetical protein